MAHSHRGALHGRVCGAVRIHRRSNARRCLGRLLHGRLRSKCTRCPSKNVVLEECARTTWESIAYSIPLIEQGAVDKIASSAFHARRARKSLAKQSPPLADRLHRARDYVPGELVLAKLLLALYEWRRSRRERRRRTLGSVHSPIEISRCSAANHASGSPLVTKVAGPKCRTQVRFDVGPLIPPARQPPCASEAPVVRLPHHR